MTLTRTPYLCPVVIGSRTNSNPGIIAHWRGSIQEPGLVFLLSLIRPSPDLDFIPRHDNVWIVKAVCAYPEVRGKSADNLWARYLAPSLKSGYPLRRYPGLEAKLCEGNAESFADTAKQSTVKVAVIYRHWSPPCMGLVPGYPARLSYLLFHTE
jgi:hypothetical protein